MKSFRFIVLASALVLSGCSGIKNINNSPDTITGMSFTFKTLKSRPKGYPCLTQSFFYLSHGNFLFKTTPLTNSEDPDLIASSGYYSYSKCGAGCGHISLYDSRGKASHNIWDVELCYIGRHHGTYTATDRGNPNIWREGKFDVSFRAEK